ncbi:MAG: FHA domain-containing protein, partial [Candidatus Desantisbacteria bacterium]
MMNLIIVKGDNKGKWFLDKDEMIIGRGKEADINLSLDDKVSRGRHAMIIYENGKYYLEDLGSKRGTLIAEKRISGKTHLPVDVEFRVGETILVLKEDEGVSITDTQDIKISYSGKVYREKVDVYEISADVLLPKEEEVILSDGDERNFCFLSIDVVDHSTLSSLFNPVDINHTLIKLQKWINSIITNKKGKGLIWAGDGGVFYFLQGKVIDKAIDNAVLSSMEILDKLAYFNDSHNQLSIKGRRHDIKLRVGIDFGRTIYRKEPGNWFSEALNIAVKIQKMALPDSILITEQVYINLTDSLRKRFVTTSTRVKNQLLYVFPEEKALDTGDFGRENRHETHQGKLPEIILGNIKNLSKENKEILTRLFMGFDTIKVFGIEAGFGGAELFLVTPANAHQDMAPFVAKIGEKWDIEEEFKGAQIAEGMLQNFCARIKGKRTEYQGKAGIKYTFAGAPLAEIKTSKEFYRTHSEDEILELLDKLFKVLGTGWYDKTDKGESYFYREFYSEVLPPDYCVQEGRHKEGIPPISDLSSLPPNPRNYWVSLENCQVLQISQRKIKAKWGDFGFIIDYYCQVPHNLEQGANI